MRTHIFQVVKSVLASVLVSLAFVLIFTVAIQLFTLPVTVIRPVNQIFKIVAIAAGGLLFIREGKGIIKGAVHGALTVIITWLIFSAIAKVFVADWKFIVEILIGAAAGAVTGIIAANIKRKT